ncbi:DUF4625 domain-containing protein [Pedobacter nototheniae]|uniref:DUF4625 domain-containing protein n=1 Tax=Pedobacter nototheniae TaxID=2488994 RepID=UPI00103D3BFB|nr:MULTISPECIES: DUF4625 domain-containing protein [Pedobacter]
MRKKIKVMAFVAGLIMLLNSCKKDEQEIDTIYPVIDITAQDAFPKQCSVLKRGDKFLFVATLSDNRELGSVSVDIHHNFDHHTHSTEVIDCSLEAIKLPVKPFLLIKDFPIPTGQQNFRVAQEISIPADVDAGDYHFLIRLTDKEGWQTIKGLSIKIN